MGFIYYVVKSISQTTTKVYFKTTYVIGQENIPEDGPLIICGNHSNQFIDPMMIMNYCNREISFTMAASSYNKKIIGSIAKLLNVIPVNRPEDYKIKGKGKLRINKENMNSISGIGTDFISETKNLGTGFSIMISNKTFIVDKVLDSQNLTLKDSKDEIISLVSSIKEQELDFFYIARVDNSILFKGVYNTLQKDGCICIFPEGTSHDRADFLKLKAGIAHFALGAMSEYKTKNIKIVPVGLNYFNRNEFRSEVIIEFGKAFEVPSELAEKFRQNKREATEILLQEIHSRMKAVTLTAPSYTELRSLLLIRKLYLPPDIRLSPKAYSSMCKKFSKGYEKLKSREETKALMTRIHKYINELEITGLSDHEVRRINLSLSWMFKKLIISYIIFHIFLIFAIPGILIVLPFILYVGKKAEKERILAKSKNPNKLEALDVVASVKIQYAFLFAPLVLFLWCLFFTYHFEKLKNKIILDLDFSYLSIIFVAIAIFPFYIYFVVVAMDYIEKCKQTFYSRFLYFVFPKKIIKLQKKRENLAIKIQNYVNKYIKESQDKNIRLETLIDKENEQLLKKESINGNETENYLSKTKKKKKFSRINEEINQFYINFNIVSTSENEQ